MNNGERITKVETELCLFKEQNTKDHKEQKEMIKEQKEMLTNFIETAKATFASKLTQNIVYTTCALILTGFIVVLTGLWDKIMKWVIN